MVSTSVTIGIFRDKNSKNHGKPPNPPENQINKYPLRRDHFKKKFHLPTINVQNTFGNSGFVIRSFDASGVLSFWRGDRGEKTSGAS